MTDPIRQERVVGYTRMVERTIVKGLRRVFTDSYAEKQLQDLRIVSEYPLTRQDYPAVIVDFNDTLIRDAGIGHQEIFYDPNGILRVWGHRRFEGSITLRCFGLTTIDRDIIYDALVECLSFWRLPHMSLQANLFAELYGSEDDPEDLFRVLSQLYLNTDRLQPGGKSVSPAPWGADDALVYQRNLTVNCVGGFYNATPRVIDPGAELVSHVFVYPHIKDSLELPLYETDEYPIPAGEILDGFIVEGEGEASADETFVD